MTIQGLINKIFKANQTQNNTVSWSGSNGLKSIQEDIVDTIRQRTFFTVPTTADLLSQGFSNAVLCYVQDESFYRWNATGVPNGTTIFPANDGGVWVRETIGDTDGTVTSVGITAPAAFTVNNSPVTTSGVIDITANGTTLQYIDGTGALQTLPTSTSTVKHQVKAGVPITKGQAVYVTSADGTNMIVGLASNLSEPTSSKTMGLLDATVSANGFANVVTEGLLSGLDTSAANAAGDPVWLGQNGNLIFGLVNKPYAPLHLVYIGVVTRKNVNNGEIFINVQNGFELDELHNVDAKNPNNNDGIFFNSTTNLWEHKQISTVIGGSPVTGSGTTSYLPKWTSSSALGNSLMYDNGTALLLGTTTPSTDYSTALLTLSKSTNVTTQEIRGSNQATLALTQGVTANSSTPAVEIFNSYNFGIRFVGGTAGAFSNYPMYYYAGDGAGVGDYTMFQVGGAERMRIVGTNVLIGTTTNAGYKLDVLGTARLGGNSLVSLNQNAETNFVVSNTTSGTGSSAQIKTVSSGGGTQLGKYSATTTAYKTVAANDGFIYNYGVGNISILNDFSTGNINFTARGASTAQVIMNGSSQPLALVGGGSSNFSMNSGNDVYFDFNSQSAVGRFYANPQGTVQNTYDQPTSVGFVGTLAGASVWYGNMNSSGGAVKYNCSLNGAAHSHIWYYNFTEQMRLQYTGNLLIGTSTDNGAKLQVNGTSSFAGDVALNGNRLYIGSIFGNTVLRPISTTNLQLFNANAGAGLFLDANGYVQIGQSNAVNWALFSASGTTIYGTTNTSFYSNGNVGIATASDAGYKLDVNGTTRLRNDAVFGIGNGLMILGRNTGGGQSQSMIQFDGANGWNFAITNFASSVFLDLTNDGRFTMGNNLIYTSRDSSAVLNLVSTSRGFLPPRMTNAQRTAIATPSVGLMVYCTDATEGLYIYKSTGWTFVI